MAIFDVLKKKKNVWMHWQGYWMEKLGALLSAEVILLQAPSPHCIHPNQMPSSNVTGTNKSQVVPNMLAS
jgi:hypothetical protein